MKITSNIDEVIKRLTDLKNQAATIDFSSALTQGVSEATASMQFRIFDKGLDKFGDPFGKYVGKKSKVTKRKFSLNSEPVADAGVRKKNNALKRKLKKNIEASGESEFTEYEKKRLAAGRQIGYKDLEFIGSLRRSIVPAADESNSLKRVVCIINNEKEKLIAEGQEFQIARIRGDEGDRAHIFALSDDERKILKESTKKALTQLYVSLFRT